jgi:hypothetical protein
LGFSSWFKFLFWVFTSCDSAISARKRFPFLGIFRAGTAKLVLFSERVYSNSSGLSTVGIRFCAVNGSICAIISQALLFISVAFYITGNLSQCGSLFITQAQQRVQRTLRHVPFRGRFSLEGLVPFRWLVLVAKRR